MHVGGVAVLDPPGAGFDYDRLVRLIGQRIALVPRYRQRVRSVPGHLANPVWVDDEHFDLTYHVRRSALP
ncbi:MAG TPA: wax ester/triacylglycerol synthase domain-containing protein, partial [Pseudonocardia sp.]|nr:wax ester/triacylglycerol synthase domain-containing protein [Pseudonocardia sp.]